MSIRPTTPTPLDHITGLTKEHSEARDALQETIDVIRAETLAVQRRHLRAFRSRARKVAETEHRLRASIEAAPDLFQKPRTIVVYGLKIGLQKGKGKTIVADEAKAIARLRNLAPLEVGDPERFIETKESLILSTLTSELKPAQLRSLGITITGTGDQVVIKATDGDLDKLLTKITTETKDLED